MDREIDTCLRVIRSGGLALVKVDIGFGLVGHYEGSIRKMYRLKGRSYSNPAIVVGNTEILRDVGMLDAPTLAWVELIAQETTLAVVVPINPASTLLAGLDTFVREHATRDGTVAVFLNTGTFLEEMTARAHKEGLLLIGTSGNLSGTGNKYQFEDVGGCVTDFVDYTYDQGECRYENPDRLATTIVNLVSGSFKRKGVNYIRIAQSYHEFKSRVLDNAYN